ncbi:MAG TPA: hypothetical protein DCM54_14555 [Gammaproteobacteria bacterium]|nr:hypothetical protein [Gammaproteobacteria bacterium]
MNRALSCLILFLFCFNPAVANDLNEQAEAALGSGDAEAALGLYLEILVNKPGDAETIEMVVYLAQELGASELAAEVLAEQVEIAIASDKERVADLHDKISEVYSAIPVELVAMQDAVSQIGDDEVRAAISELRTANCE